MTGWVAEMFRPRLGHPAPPFKFLTSAYCVEMAVASNSASDCQWFSLRFGSVSAQDSMPLSCSLSTPLSLRSGTSINARTLVVFWVTPQVEFVAGRRGKRRREIDYGRKMIGRFSFAWSWARLLCPKMWQPVTMTRYGNHLLTNFEAD